MAVNKTGAIYKSLTFDGEDSRDYGVYITGQAVFNAPEREVEMISIPGRNGQFALDKGRFENIEVTYPAGIFANTEAEFAEAVSNFRNLLCSRRGYVRLQDEYHPDEYRMAIYKSGLEIENVALKAGEFEITFDCKPQRYLTSGEEEQDISSWEDVETYSGAMINFTADGSKTVKSLVADIDPIQDLSNGSPSLSNICPISGWDDIEIQSLGKNMLPVIAYESIGYNPAVGSTITPTLKNRQWTDNGDGTFTMTLSSWEQAGFVSPRLAAGQYTIGLTTVTAGIRYGLYVVNADNTLNRISQIRNGTVANEVFSVTTILTEGQWFAMYIAGGGGTATIKEPQLESGPSSTTYEPYNSTTYTATLPSTVYGGSLDFANGALNIKPYYASYNGETLVGEWVSDRDEYVEGTTPTTGAQVVNIGAVGTNMQITAQQVSLLTGVNNIFADSGDVEMEIGVKSSSGTLTNPTLFDAEPLLEVEGYGNIAFNGYNIEIANATMGEVEIVSNETMTQTSFDPGTETTVSESQDIPISDYANVGDDFTASFNITEPLTGFSIKSVKSATISTPSSNGSASVSFSGKNVSVKINGAELSGTTNTNAQATASCTASVVYVNNLDATLTATISISVTLDYDATLQKTTVTSDINRSGGGFVTFGDTVAVLGSFVVDSTVSILGHPTYIDCELGECYRIENGTVISLNRYIDLGSDLPKLAPGGNEFTIDNTITELKVVPRWWKV